MVREAVAALRAEGLVVTRQGVGAFVSAEPPRAPFRIEPERMQSLDDILAVMELRLGVEIESAGLAAERASAAQLRAIGCGLEKRSSAAPTGRSAVDEDLAFHRAIADATGNAEVPALPAVHRPPPHPAAHRERAHRAHGRRARLPRAHPGRAPPHLRRRSTSRDPRAARDAMRRHLTRSIERYRKLAAEQKKAA